MGFDFKADIAPNVRVGSVFAVQRGFATADHDAAVHEAEIGHYWTLRMSSQRVFNVGSWTGNSTSELSH